MSDYKTWFRSQHIFPFMKMRHINNNVPLLQPFSTGNLREVYCTALDINVQGIMDFQINFSTYDIDTDSFTPQSPLNINGITDTTINVPIGCTRSDNWSTSNVCVSGPCIYTVTAIKGNDCYLPADNKLCLIR